jgi:chromate reductase
LDDALRVTPKHDRWIRLQVDAALAVTSRPYSDSRWSARPAAVASASPDPVGGFGASQHLRQSLAALNVPTKARPEVCLGHADRPFDANGALVGDSTRRLLRKFMRKHAAWLVATTPP